MFLEEMGVEYVFGVPGGAIVVLFDELCKSDQIKVVPTKTEAGAAFMAAAYARISGNMGVCIATSGPGLQILSQGYPLQSLMGCLYWQSPARLPSHKGDMGRVRR